ncbi:T9SS type A sorting domain-containing protein [Flammeovirga yaeyamensis]|uniref:T9SS type A sorting domain-containing protein n=1 Tax=Flammeovirga yaeyamensis TaxID=367791 RepID=A0AAX1NFA2_9BACT|nr:T9SS type A sorting domain-containing protein [Flammeovirga yaeyamensis]MBB3696904.1 hypothetical protein [Flammeovirga yaeyamensis]NMF33568.1 T9SS type A sorting domain-containing protein [Flammeovirga yaeyamensis]QWG05163.1 T9SS type A sorting domain-containing protein [Flammeovirga yaeyamensis]
MKKRIQLLLLMVCGILLHGNAQVIPTEGDGTAENPYLVSSLDHLRWISEGDGGLGDGQRWQLHYKQTADIDATATKDWHSGEGFRPMGDLNKKFRGSYDGDGFKISNLYINRIVDHVGLFGYIDEAGIVKNVHLIDMNVTGDRFVGGLAGLMDNQSTLSNNLLTGAITGRRFLGGIVGEANNESIIEKNISFVTITGTGEVGNNDNRGAGGIAGRIYNKTQVVHNYFAGGINVGNQTGGLFALSHTTVVVSNTYWDTETTGLDIADAESKFPDVKGLTTSEFGVADNFMNWDFDNQWAIAKVVSLDDQFRPFFQSITKRTIELSANDDTFGSVSGGGVHHLGNNVTVTASANTAYTFVHWLNGDDIASTEAEYTFEVSEDLSLKAVFEIKQLTITVTQVDNGTITPATTTVEYGSSQKFTIEAAEGYEILDVKVDDESKGAIAEYTFEDVVADHSIKASFKEIVLPTYTITVTQGENGTITPGTIDVTEGEAQTFEITASEGYEISDVLVDGTSVGQVSEYTFENVMSTHTITASFTEVVLPTYTITVTQGENGTITPSTIDVTEGDDQTFEIVPSEGYEISDVLVDGASVGQVSTYTFENVMSTHTITASFTEVEVPIEKFTITVIQTENGNITPETMEVVAGQNQTFVISANEGYEIEELLIDDELVEVSESYTFTDVQADHTISAIFVEIEEPPLSIDDIHGIKVGPNPTSNTIQLFGVPQNTNFTIHDVLGNVLLNEQTNTLNQRIDVSTYQRGVYILTLENYGSVRIIKQ